ncbi:MAG TPA: ATP-binding cassette domain-containing protein [Ignavibacteriaceae bacterium]|nr:ATP-binding cassette domain-containing protein [Ignavibacteriaceae bacterium]
MNNILEINNLNYSVKSHRLLGSESDKIILRDVSLSVNERDIIGITGESGSGKTTLAKLIAGVNVPTSGKVYLKFSENWKNFRTNPVQILFQNNNEILNPYRKVEDIVKESFLIRNNKKDNVEIELEKIFSSIGLDNRIIKRKGFELSGGEQQRAALARILAARPELLILDEPFSAQDVESQLNLLNLLKKINKEFGLTMICVAHNLKILRKLADRIFVMYNGEIVESGKTKEIFETPKNDYTKFLLRCENYDLKYEELKFSQSN